MRKTTGIRRKGNEIMATFNKQGFVRERREYIGATETGGPITVVLYGEGFVGDNYIWDRKAGRSYVAPPSPTGNPKDRAGQYKFFCNAFDLADNTLKVLQGSYKLMKEIQEYGENAVGTALTIHQTGRGNYAISHAPLTKAQSAAATAVTLMTFDKSKATTKEEVEADSADEIPF